MNTLNHASGAYDRNAEITRIDADWAENPRFQHVARTYSADDVVRLRGSMKRDNMLARRGAEKLWDALNDADNAFIDAQTILTGGEAVQHVKAGTQAINLPGQAIVAVRQINHAFARADQIQWKAGQQPGSSDYIDYFAPIIAEAGCHGVLSAYELTQNLIRAGAAGVHFDDQCTDHMGETIFEPAQDAVQKLIAARLAADVEDVPTLIVARTHASATELLMADCDSADQPFVVGERSEEGFYRIKGGIDLAITRGLAYAPYADLLCLETTELNLAEAAQFADAIRREYPNQLLAFSCINPLHANTTEAVQRELTALGYTFQFIGSDRRHQESIDSRAA